MSKYAKIGHDLDRSQSAVLGYRVSCCCAVQVVATYHCDQAYAFDVSGTGSCTTAYSSAASSAACESSTSGDIVMEEAEPAGRAGRRAAGAPTRQDPYVVQGLLLHAGLNLLSACLFFVKGWDIPWHRVNGTAWGYGAHEGYGC